MRSDECSGLFAQAAIVGLIVAAVLGFGWFAEAIQRVPMIGFVAQVLGAAYYWSGVAISVGLASVVLLIAAGPLSRWWLLLPAIWIVIGLHLHVTSSRRAHETAALLGLLNADTGLAPPLPIPVGAEPNDGDWLIGGYRTWPLQPRDSARHYTISRGPCGPAAQERYGPDRIARRLTPLVRSLERRVSRQEGRAAALCVTSLHRWSGPTMFTVEIRSAAAYGTWMNPRRGVQTVVRRPWREGEIAVLHQGAVDALAPFLFVSWGCRYDSAPNVRGCGRFAITQESAYIH